MARKRNEQLRAKMTRAGFLFSFCVSVFFFGLFILYSFNKDLNESGQYLEGIGIIVPTDKSLVWIVFGMAFLFIAFLLRFGMTRKRQTD